MNCTACKKSKAGAQQSIPRVFVGTEVGSSEEYYIYEGGEKFFGTALEHAKRIFIGRQKITKSGAWLLLKGGERHGLGSMPVTISEMIAIFENWKSQITAGTHEIKDYHEWEPANKRNYIAFELVLKPEKK